jgi:integrase
MYTFNSQQIKKLLSVADIQMRAMIWLGLSCGFGCTDCAQLKWKDLDFKNSRVKLARNKTGVRRNLPLKVDVLTVCLKKIVVKGILLFDFEFFIGVRLSNRGISLSHRYVTIMGQLKRGAEFIGSMLVIVTFYTTISALS